MMDGHAIGKALFGVLVLLGAATAMVWCLGCVKPAMPALDADHALIAKQYDKALDVCSDLAARESTPQLAGEIFDACAADVDKRWCEQKGLRCGGKR